MAETEERKLEVVESPKEKPMEKEETTVAEDKLETVPEDKEPHQQSNGTEEKVPDHWIFFSSFCLLFLVRVAYRITI